MERRKAERIGRSPPHPFEAHDTVKNGKVPDAVEHSGPGDNAPHHPGLLCGPQRNQVKSGVNNEQSPRGLLDRSTA